MSHLRVVARLIVAPENAAAARGIFGALLAPTRREEGCFLYELLEELSDAAEGALHLEVAETVLGQGQVLAKFPFDQGFVAGTRVIEGRFARGDLVRVARGESEIGRGKIKSLRIGKEENSKVEVGKECGVLLDGPIDFQPGDSIICYRI